MISDLQQVQRLNTIVVMSNFSSYRFLIGGADQSNLPGSPEKRALPENRWSELSLNGLKRYIKSCLFLKHWKTRFLFEFWWFFTEIVKCWFCKKPIIFTKQCLFLSKLQIGKQNSQ